ncbi:MAG TPA: hypothetical protein VK465_04840 [Fibrobacteria bacterium]|nr:hypothetical protein [Fibrobacteria bacterium]
MHNNWQLGLLALISMIGFTVFVSPRHGWLAMAVFILAGSIWGVFFGKGIQLKYFGKLFLLEGRIYRLYCLFTLMIGIGIIVWFFYSA